MENIEEWKQSSLNEKLLISNFGNIREISSNKILEPGDNGCGYLVCRGKYVHRLVASEFVENLLNKPQVNHKDGNKKNNHFLNLEWMTASENVKHAYATGLNENVKKATSKAITKLNKEIDRSGERTPLQKEAIKKWGIAGTAAAVLKERTEKQRENYKLYNDAAAEKNGKKVVVVNIETKEETIFRSISMAAKLENIKKSHIYNKLKIDIPFKTEKYLYILKEKI